MASSRINEGASGIVMVISKMRRPASRSHWTAVAACRASRVRITGTTRAARSVSNSGWGIGPSGERTRTVAFTRRGRNR